MRWCLLLPLLALGGCAGPNLVDTGEVAIVPSVMLPPPTTADLTTGTRPHLIGPGDAITVEVFGLAELSREVRVDAEGNIALPLAGTIKAGGTSPEELAKAVEERLRTTFVRDPRVTVGITETVSQVVTVDGAVRKPGIYPVIGQMTLMRAIARAEGTNEFARTNHVVVFRTVEGRQMAALYDLRAIRLGAYQDPQVYTNDVVVVGESMAARLFPQALQASSLLLTPVVALLNNNWIGPVDQMNELSFNPAATDGHGQASTNAVFEPARPTEQPIIVRYINIAMRWKWLLLGAVVVGSVIGLVVTLLMTPQYTASATIEIQRENDRIVNVQGVEPENGPVDLEFYETQWGLLQSRTLAERVTAELRLHDDPAFFEMFGATDYAEALRESRASGRTASQREARLRAAADILLDHVEIAPERRSRLVNIQFTSPSPGMATQVANTWGQAFIEISLERRFEATSYARNFLEERLNQLRERLQDSERQLVSYAANQRIVNVPTSTTTGGSETGTTERPLVAEDLSILNEELNEAVAARIAAQTRLRGSGGNTTEALGSQAISDLRSRRAALASDYARFISQFEPAYPPARALADQIAELDRAIAREESRVRSTLEQAYASAAARESMLRERVDMLKAQLVDLRGRTIQYNIYQREVDTNRQLYDALLQRYKEIGVAGGIGVNNISIVDPAQVPEAPSSPHLILNLLVAIMIGGMIGAGLALALEQIDETISDPRELNAALDLPLLGTIPNSEEEHPTEELDDPKTPIVEAYLSALTRLGFTTEHGIPRTLAVTSTRPGEGKSTTAYALARQLARTSRRVVLVDGDMRSPSLHQMFGKSNERGLSNYLAGDDGLANMIHTQPNRPAVMFAGPMPPNAAELLTGDRMAKLVRELSAKYEHVIVDAPPVMGLADTPLIGSMVEGVVFVVESHETRTSLARVAVGRLRDSQARILGALLTKFQAEKAQYGYGYEYGYGYGGSRREASAA